MEHGISFATSYSADLLPAAGCAGPVLHPQREQEPALRWTALITSLVTFGISLWVLGMFNASNPTCNWSPI
jgi:NADH:ubiquinone oxidoreductase subunit 4 (subunit M)